MDAATAVALEASIEKWKRNAEGEDISRALIFSSDCPLCHLYLLASDDLNKCDGCPVFIATGIPQCGGSPWTKAFVALVANDLPAFRFFAQAEVEFLESLRETSADQKEIV